MIKCERFRVSGRVQGVGFRYATLHEAHRLGLSGWVRNLPDGRVEVLAQGAPDRVEALCAWLQRGPPAARVTGVERSPEPATALPPDFDIR
ncbi:MAG TPA: acylphosphatase [Nevskiales bacterium]|nr:acylphosphatase [Nevskiales bacterium]